MTAKHLLSEIVAGLDGVKAKSWTLEDHLLTSPEDGLIADLGYCVEEYHSHFALCSPDRIRAIAAYVEQLEKALEPFVNDWADEDGWTDHACQRDRIVDWFGPSDFRRARAALGGSNE